MRLFLLIFFFLSGACGLVYEVVWIKLFVFSMGGTTYALSTVLAAFMGGLALGSRYGGKWIDRRGDPFPVYGVIEGLIGVYCLLLPSLVKLIPVTLSPLYDDYYTNNLLLFGFLRFLLSFAILIFPTLLMGASLPVLAKYYAREKKRFGWEVGRLYAVNTLGACVGAFSAGFILLPMLGQTLAVYSAAAVNIGIFIIVMILWIFFVRGRDVERVEPEEKDDTPAPEIAAESEPAIWGKPILWAALFLYAVNGFAGMAYQVAWTRALTLSIGSSTYSFTIIVTIFIFGLAAGGAVGARVADKLRNPATTMAWIEIVIGFLALYAMWGLGRLPEWMVPVVKRFYGDYRSLLQAEFALVAMLIILPTFLMGAVFPLAIKTVGLCRSGVGEPVGLAYGLNTFGAIAGSLGAGFVLIPLVGLQNTIGAANLLNWLAGAVLLVVAGTSRPVRRWALSWSPLVLGLTITFIIPRWDTTIMNSGPFIYGMKQNEARNKLSPSQTLLYYKEGVDTTVSVFRSYAGDISLRVNGKADASSGMDMYTQELSGHIPMLLHGDPKDVLIVGLASGVTLGSVTRYDVDKVDVVEISQAVVEASDKFKAFNYNALRDPRVNLIVGDGRNHMVMTGKKYDVVISEPSNPWIAGIASLFTREYFESAADKLNEGGIFCCWLQGYAMSSDVFLMVMRTFKSVFPQVNLWETLDYDFVLVGSFEKISFDLNRFESSINNAGIAEDLARVDINNAAELLGKFVMNSRRFTMATGEGEIHVDDRLQLEYRAPQYLYSTENIFLPFYEKVFRFREDPGVIITTPRGEWPEGFAKALEAEIVARNADQAARGYEAEGRMVETFQLISVAVKNSPKNQTYRDFFKKQSNKIGTMLIKEGKIKEALAFYTSALTVFPEEPDIHGQVAAVYMILKESDKAREHFELAYKYNPKDFIALYNLAVLDMQSGNYEEGMKKIRRTLTLNPNYTPAYSALGKMAANAGNLEEAETNLRKSIELKPSDPNTLVDLGMILSQHKDKKIRIEGFHYLEKALEIDPKLRENEYFMSVYRAKKSQLR